MRLSRKIAKNTLIYFCGQLSNLGLNLVVLVWLARYLGEAQFGMFSYALVFVSFFAVLPDFGMKPIIVREIARDRDKSLNILGNSFWIKLVFCGAAMIAASVSAVLLGYDHELIIIIGILSLNMLVSAKLFTLRVVFESIFEADLKIEYPFLFKIVDGIALLGFIAFVIHLNGSLRTVSLFYILGSLPGLFLTGIVSIKYLRPDLRFRWKIAKWLLIESFPLAVFAALAIVCNNVDVFALKTMKGDGAVGLYSAAFRLVYPLDFIPAAIVTSLFPLMSKYHQDSSEKLVKSFEFGIKILILIGLGFSLGATFLHQRIIRFLYTESYEASAVPFMILMWAGLLGFVNFFMLNFNISVNRQKRNTYFVIIMVLVSIVANTLLIPRWGLKGAGLAKLFTAGVGSFVLFLSLSSNFRALFPPILKKAIPIAVLFSTWLFVVSKFNILCALALSPVIFITITMLLRLFSETEIKIIKDLFIRMKT